MEDTSMYQPAGTLGQDPETRSVIQKSSKNNPRYLFRVWCSTSGGSSSLNTTEAITPSAFAYSEGHDSVYEMKTTLFVNKLVEHFDCSRMRTEFSSWTASPVFAVRLAIWTAEEKKKQNVHIAIVDTEKLKNTVFSVLSTEPIFRAHRPDYVELLQKIHFEYLIHGKIQGQAYKAVQLTTLNNRGLSTYFSEMKSTPVDHRFIGRHVLLQLPRPAMDLSTQEGKILLKIAELYGELFRAPFFIALICCKSRPGFLTKPDLPRTEQIVKLLGGCDKIPDWSTSSGVVCDNIYDSRYEDGRQMQTIMRALIEVRQHGE